MKIQDIQNFMFGTLRGRLIFGVAIVQAVMMTLFIMDLTVRQRVMLLERQEEQAIALSESLSTSAATWLEADDISGLQELADAQRRYPELIFAMLVDESGRVLAHTDRSKQGLYLADLPKEARQTVMSKTPALVDVAAPATVGNKHVGWARVGIGQKAAGKTLSEITRSGVFYALAAIVLGSGIAWLMGFMLTRRLYAVQDAINKVQAGDSLARARVSGSDEAAALGREFNAMLETLAERNAALRTSEENFRHLIDDSPVAIVVTVHSDSEVRYVNKKFTELFGYTIEDIPDIAHWWPLAYPDEIYRTRIMKEWVSSVEKAVKRKETIEPMEALVNCRNGSKRYIEFYMSLIGTGALITFIDITGRKQAEEALRKNTEIVEKIFSMTTTCIAYMDRNFNFIRVNEEYAAADGKTPEYFIGKNHFDLFPNEENKLIFNRVAEEGEQYVAYAKPFEYKEHPERGVSVWDWSLTPAKDASGKVEALILSLVNVTDRIKAQEDLGKLNEELELRVAQRTAELERNNAELEKVNRLFVGRELRMVQLKEKIKELEKRMPGGE